MGPTTASVAAGLLLLGLFFGSLERAWPAIAGRPLGGLPTDVAYWFFTPAVPEGFLSQLAYPFKRRAAD